MSRSGFSPATRSFEAAGSGACLITNQWEGIELFLEPAASEVLGAWDGAKESELLNGLSRESARCIGVAALRRVLLAHTYSHLALQMGVAREGNLVSAER